MENIHIWDIVPSQKQTTDNNFGGTPMTIYPHAIKRLGSKRKAARPIYIKATPKMLFPILLLLATLAVASDVTGKWNGSLEFKGEDGQTQTASAHADLKQQGSSITGQIWKEEDQHFEIEQGQVTGNEISFKFRAPEGEAEEVIVHSVRLTLVSPTQLQGTLEFDVRGQRLSGKLTFRREK